MVIQGGASICGLLLVIISGLTALMSSGGKHLYAIWLMWHLIMNDDIELVPMRIKLSELDVISSGTILSSSNDEVKLELGSISSPFVIILAFKDSEGGNDSKKRHFTGKVLGPQSLPK
jgi:hypothetical protein